MSDADTTHRLLLRQLKRIGLTELGTLPDATKWAELLARVSASYREAEQERYVLERALSVSSQELQELNEARTRFFSRVSHELRTPLALIMGPVEAALQGREPLTPALLQSISANARQLLEYVNALLGLAQTDGAADSARLKQYFEAQSIESQAVEPAVSRAEIDKLNQDGEESRRAGVPTILCVEENTDLLKYTHGLLKERYNVYLAVSGTDALEKIKQQPPDLILADLVMPDMDGIDLCRRVRADPSLQFTSFILLTAKSGMEHRIRGLEAGADDFISQPLYEPELLARIENLMALRNQQRRLKRDLRAARLVQRAIMPGAEEVFEEASLEALFMPAEDLSGDFYDIIRHGDRVIFYLADVTQHGTASAQITFLLKEIFLGALGDHQERTLQEIVRKTGERYASYGLDYGIAIQAMDYNLKTRKLEYLRGGAPSPVKVSKSGAAYVAGHSSFPLSKSFVRSESGSSLQTTTIDLQPGEKVYFFTDGLFSLCSGERVLSARQVLTLFGEAEAARGKSWRDHVSQALEGMKGHARAEDDVSILRLSAAE